MSRWWSERGQTAALRLAWWVHMACTLTLFVVGLLAQVRDGFWQLPAAYTTPAAPILVRMIPAVGPVYPFLLLMAYVQAVAFVTIGLFLFWRKADERIGILASWMLIAIGIGFTPTIVLLPLRAPAWHLPTSLFQAGLFGTIFFFLCLFPDGRFYPSSIRIVAVLWTGYALLWPFLPQLNPHRTGSAWPVLLLAAIAWLGIVMQWLRYQRQSTPIERQQTKWVIAGFVAANFGLFLVGLVSAAGGFQSTTYLAASISMFGMASLAIPLTICVALVRYRLFDINIIIRKSLVYAVLSALLALVYFGSVVLLQNIVGSAADEQSPLVIVVSTLLIAALFTPLRRRVQVFIDRRFYRQKYDAQQVLAQFAQTARDEVEMEVLQAELLRVVQETLQPEVTAVWLREHPK